MDYADSWTSVDCNSDHACDVVQVTLSEALSTIERIDPDDHLFLEELIRELVVVVVSFRRRHAINLLHLLQVLPVAVPLHFVVLEQHLLADVSMVELIRHDVGFFSCYLIYIVIFLTYDCRPRI